ncbi:hypothetical protein E2C01_102597 [Portunus trituberculatus]|uniref:Uncharacterized protein n=1 Tax=Portunus trituberculatus TaxID=210409 RepID=A0A5B7KN66_PORTR|nr:hypothetical protein [Portunus trituberculatus]
MKATRSAVKTWNMITPRRSCTRDRAPRDRNMQKFDGVTQLLLMPAQCTRLPGGAPAADRQWQEDLSPPLRHQGRQVAFNPCREGAILPPSLNKQPNMQPHWK